jgi:hypothetical protein
MASNSKKAPPKPLETSDASAPPAASSPKDSFRDEIAKSKAMIGEADKVPDAPQVKNKGGRPSKEEVKQREDALKAARIDELNRVAPPESLKAMVALPFDLLAMRTGFPGWRLSPEEANAIVPSLHQVVLTYAPAFQGENVAVLALAGALFSIGIGKYLGFLQSGATDGPNSSGAEAESPPAAAPTSKGEATFFPPGMHVT